MNKIELTEEQKKCVEYPLDKRVLIISADPGTGKTEVLKYRALFIHRQNQQQRKLILVLAYGRNIATEISTKLKAGKLKVYDRFKNLLPVVSTHQHPISQEDQQPLFLVCTIHSLTFGLMELVIKEQFQEKRKIKILVVTRTIEKKIGIVPVENKDKKFAWKSRGAIKTGKKRIFNYLLNSIDKKYLENNKWKILWGIFSQSKPNENVILGKIFTPLIHYKINYLAFLSEARSLLSEDEELLTNLAESCQHDQENNIWMDFDDLIENANNLKNQARIWPEFDYILVDECQDLKIETLNLITEIYATNQTNLTFVGDPKQNIYGFAGATENIFNLLQQKYPQEIQSAISKSFRLPKEIADFTNHFIQKFMEKYRPAIQTTKSNGGHKPLIITVGQELDYQLNSQEEAEIEAELVENPELKRVKLIQAKIRTKKLHQHLDAVLPIISKLDNSASKAILYRQNWIGELLQTWLSKKGVMTSISEAIIDDILRKVHRQFKGLIKSKISSEELLAEAKSLKERAVNQFKDTESLRNWSLNEALKLERKAEKQSLQLESSWSNFPSLKIFLVSCRISVSSIFQLTEIVKKLDENHNISMTDKINNFITRLEEIKNLPSIILSTIHGMKGLEADHVFLVFCDRKVLPKKEVFKSEWEEREEKNLFFTAITRPKERLYITTSSSEECSDFIKTSNLNLDLVKLK